jgi:hypothetical protein
VYNYNSGAPSDLLSLLTALPAIQNAGIHPKDYDTMQVLHESCLCMHMCMQRLLLNAPVGLAEGFASCSA